jgi:hypothetical protein
MGKPSEDREEERREEEDTFNNGAVRMGGYDNTTALTHRGGARGFGLAAQVGEAHLI